jgi:hypothetical protein
MLPFCWMKQERRVKSTSMTPIIQVNDNSHDIFSKSNEIDK